MQNLLSTINSPEDLSLLSYNDLDQLCSEIRELIIRTCASNGGHLAPSLGVVELTVAIHRVFRSPEDRIVWDVGHQSYAHKIITGRRDVFPTLRKTGGISGFPKRSESLHDVFDTGHSSTSISAALGVAVGRDLLCNTNKVVAVIGDGSMTGGIAFEGLNHAGHLNKDLVVILNDNEMSIAENVGALSNFLSRTITNEFVHKIKKDMESFLEGLDGFGKGALKIAKRAEESLKGIFTPGMLFEAFGFEYVGPIDGHDIKQMQDTFTDLRNFDDAVLIHVLTKKGKGYLPAEKYPSMFHGIGPFDADTGKVLKGMSEAVTYTAQFGEIICKLASEDERVVALTAAMPDGTGLTKFAREYPERFFDVGIAEQHAVTFAAGLAADGFRPFVALYSSFLQRAYDQVLHDVCNQNLPVIFAIDRAGVVGSDGPTHHGIFDLAYMRHIPNMTIMSPKDENELQHMLFSALKYGVPTAVRYPRGSGVGVPIEQMFRLIPRGKGEVLRDSESSGAIIAIGNMVYSSLLAADILLNEGLSLAVVNARFIKPLDKELILSLAAKGPIFTVEDHAIQGGLGSALLELLEEAGVSSVQVTRLGYPDKFIEQGEQGEIHERYYLSPTRIAKRIKAVMP
jgi:1-deoxy-D-xylulose-5-phosphate synthase